MTGIETIEQLSTEPRRCPVCLLDYRYPEAWKGEDLVCVHCKPNWGERIRGVIDKDLQQLRNSIAHYLGPTLTVAEAQEFDAHLARVERAINAAIRQHQDELEREQEAQYKA